MNRKAISKEGIGGFFCARLQSARALPEILHDKSIPRIDVDTSCERCPLAPEECKERAVPATIYTQLKEQQEREELLRRLIAR